MAIQGEQNSPLQHLHHLLYSIDAMFRPIDGDDSEYYNHACCISQEIEERRCLLMHMENYTGLDTGLPHPHARTSAPSTRKATADI